MTLRFFLILLSALSLFACSATKKTLQPAITADQAFLQHDYTLARSLYEQQIAGIESSGRADTCLLYEKAATACLMTGDSAKAESYYKLAVYHHQTTPRSFAYLAGLARRSNNLSRELMTLEGLAEQHPGAPETIKVLPRLFDLFASTAQYDAAANTWTAMNESQKDAELLAQWLRVARQLGRDNDCDTAAEALLLANPNHLEALSWKAIRLYDKGEARYQQEVADYEKQKTHARYAKMLKGLEQATADFKAALPLFEKAYGLSPDGRTARYIYNIYARFGDEANAARYKRLSDIQ